MVSHLNHHFDRRLQLGDHWYGLFLGRRAAFLATAGVITTAVGYAGGFTPNPTYEEACSGLTGHSEVVLVVFDPANKFIRITFACVLGIP